MATAAVLTDAELRRQSWGMWLRERAVSLGDIIADGWHWFTGKVSGAWSWLTGHAVDFWHWTAPARRGVVSATKATGGFIASGFRRLPGTARRVIAWPLRLVSGLGVTTVLGIAIGAIAVGGALAWISERWADNVHTRIVRATEKHPAPVVAVPEVADEIVDDFEVPSHPEVIPVPDFTGPKTVVKVRNGDKVRIPILHIGNLTAPDIEWKSVMGVSNEQGLYDLAMDEEKVDLTLSGLEADQQYDMIEKLQELFLLLGDSKDDRNAASYWFGRKVALSEFLVDRAGFLAAPENVIEKHVTDVQAKFKDLREEDADGFSWFMIPGFRRGFTKQFKMLRERFAPVLVS